MRKIKSTATKKLSQAVKNKAAGAHKTAAVNYAQKYAHEANEIQHVVNESTAVYAAALSPKTAANGYYNSIQQNIASKVQALKDILQPAKKHEGNITAYEKIELINKGISKKDLEYLKEKSGLGYDQLAEILSVARATLINKKGSEKFNASLSEKIVSLADIYSYGYEVFEDEARFNKWIFRPNQALGGKPPFNFLGNQYGREEIKNLIGRIDYGVYA
jgi:putative toxin-antitoxin system antitoxin component (TIGR02293 family)